MPNDVDRTLSMGIDAYNAGLSVVGECDKELPEFSVQLNTPLSVQYRAELLSYLLFLAETHGSVDERRAEFIRKVLDYDFKSDEFTDLMHRLDLHKQDFGGLIPTSLRAAYQYDLKHGTKNASETIIRVLDRLGDAFRLYSMNKDMLEEMDQRIYILSLTNWLAAQGFSDTLNMAIDVPLPEAIPSAIPSLDLAGTQNQFEKQTEEKRKLEEEQVPEPEDLDTLMKELNDLTGLDSVKEDVNSLVNLLKIKKLRKERNFSDIDVSMHLVFTGNPGTGKTTVARLLARIYHALGALSKGQLIEVDRSELVSGYVGQTAIKTQEVTNSAKGGVLFIDEAYALTSGKDKSDFGYEAVNTLLVEMENNRSDLAVIVAGYPKPMEDFLQSNPGLKSRFNKFIDFPDYTPEELYSIFESMCSKSGYTLSEDSKNKVKDVFTRMYENRDRDFANGRTVRNYFEKAMVHQANRLAKASEITDEMLAALEPEDLEDYPVKKSEKKGEKKYKSQSELGMKPDLNVNHSDQSLDHSMNSDSEINPSSFPFNPEEFKQVSNELSAILAKAKNVSSETQSDLCVYNEPDESEEDHRDSSNQSSMEQNDLKK